MKLCLSLTNPCVFMNNKIIIIILKMKFNYVLRMDYVLEFQIFPVGSFLCTHRLLRYLHSFHWPNFIQNILKIYNLSLFLSIEPYSYWTYYYYYFNTIYLFFKQINVDFFTLTRISSWFPILLEPLVIIRIISWFIF